MQIGLIIYILINVITLILYALDKIKAIKHSYRVPENFLLIFSFLGPVGAFLSMWLFRHKIRKRKFTVSVFIFLCIHVFVFTYHLNF